MEILPFNSKKIPFSFYLVVVLAVIVFYFSWCSVAHALIRGVCSDCHTMHNSQGNEPMNFNTSVTPNDSLVRGTCLGCHAQGGTNPSVLLGTSSIPQVLHTGTVDLAGGNFGYITGDKGSGAADNKGHNPFELTGTDDTLYAPPGAIGGFGHNSGSHVNGTNLTCAGTNGCHGGRLPDGTGPEGITGAHHQNVDGQLAVADSVGNSYRFLLGVRGFESEDWQENASGSDHNEYFGRSTPIQLGCGITSCHGPGGVQSPDGTLSQFCATCHGNFHTLETTDATGVGSIANSPFIRHPTDLALPATGEYAGYTVYDLNSPVARTSIPGAASSSVTPGSDTVMCLSCHVAHASNYPSMLRWDYDTMIAGNGGAASGTGCFACHTTKD